MAFKKIFDDERLNRFAENLARNSSPYEIGRVQKNYELIQREKRRLEFIDNATRKITSFTGDGHISPYDLGTMGKIQRIYDLSKYIK